MYTCNLCSNDYPYLIFEYNALVCENCSIHKNIKNADELPAFDCDDIVEEEVIEVEEEDVEELLAMIEQIKNPRIREDFMDIVQEYLGNEDTL